MSFIKLVLFSTLSFFSITSMATEQKGGMAFPHNDQTLEILTNEITLSDGRSFSTRLRVCDTITACQVYMIPNEEILEKIQQLMKRWEAQLADRQDMVEYVNDAKLPYIKYITNVRLAFWKKASRY